MKKLLFITKDTQFQGNKKCIENKDTLNVGTLLNFVTNIVKQRVKNLLFNKIQFNVTNYTSKCDTAYVELNPDFIETLTPKLITGSTDNPLANNGLQVITPNVKNIVVYDKQLEFVNSIAEPNTSTLKLNDSFVNSFLTEETDPIFTASPAKNITNQDITNWNNKLDKEEDTLQSVTDRGNITTNAIIVDGLQGQARLKHSDGSGPALWLADNFRIDYTVFNDRNRINTVNKWLEFAGNGTTRMMLKPTGELGINVPNPTATLHTNGSIKHENITNAQGDSTFTKTLTAKPDGTIGWEDKQDISKVVKSVSVGLGINAFVKNNSLQNDIIPLQIVDFYQNINSVNLGPDTVVESLLSIINNTSLTSYDLKFNIDYVNYNTLTTNTFTYTYNIGGTGWFSNTIQDIKFVLTKVNADNPTYGGLYSYIIYVNNQIFEFGNFYSKGRVKLRIELVNKNTGTNNILLNQVRCQNIVYPSTLSL